MNQKKVATLLTIPLLVFSLFSCTSKDEEDQPATTSVTFKVPLPVDQQAITDTTGVSFSLTLLVDGVTWQAASGDADTGYVFVVDLSLDQSHVFSGIVRAGRAGQFQGDVIITTSADQSIYVANNSPQPINIQLTNLSFNYDDDADTINNWDEIKAGSNPLLAQPLLQNTLIANNVAGGNSDDWAFDVAAIKAGGWVAVGTSSSISNHDMVVWKFGADGLADTNFGNNGVFIHNSAAGGNGQDIAYGVTATPDGGWLVVGHSYDGTELIMAAWKFNSSGVLDDTFNSDGVFVQGNTAVKNPFDEAQGVINTADGGWLIVGRSKNDTDQDMALWKLDSKGELDTKVFSGGIFTYDGAVGGAPDGANDATIIKDGSWVVVGYSSNGTDNDIAVWKFDATGALDTQFADNGVFIQGNAAGGNGYDTATSVIPTADGGWVVAGNSKGISSAAADMTLWKFTATGELDVNFGNAGMYFYESATAADIELDKDGKWLVMGANYNNPYPNMMIWRFQSDGSVDTTFNGSGVLVHDYSVDGLTLANGNGIAQSINGDWMIVGRAQNTDNDMAVWSLRY